MRKLSAALFLGSLLHVAALAATKTTVSQLDILIAELNDQHKPDAAIATRLKDIELTEQLTTAAASHLMQYKPGRLTVRQILLLSVESSLLPPPAADLPKLPAPDSSAQTDLLKRAHSYAGDTLAHLPRLTANKQSIRFQNGLAYIKNTSGNGSMFGADTPAEVQQRVYPIIIAQQNETIITEAGVEQNSAIIKQKDPAGPLGQVPQGVPGLPVATVLLDLQTSPTPAFLRWETLNGRPAAVFVFTVNAKQSHYKLNYCCFPAMENVGSGMAIQSNSGSLTTFHPYQAARGYHGELFLDAATGVIVRLITQVDTKPTDFVQQEDIRVDFNPVAVAEAHYIVPTRSVILLTVVPNGDAYVKSSTRRTLFDITYTHYEAASTVAAHH